MNGAWKSEEWIRTKRGMKGWINAKWMKSINEWMNKE